jgi:hypothetical protein
MACGGHVLNGSGRTPREGSVLSFLKAEWQVSSTGSVPWVSSLYVQSEAVHEINGQNYVNHQTEGLSTDFIGKKRCRNLLLLSLILSYSSTKENVFDFIVCIFLCR